MRSFTILYLQVIINVKLNVFTKYSKGVLVFVYVYQIEIKYMIYLITDTTIPFYIITEYFEYSYFLTKIFISK